MKLRTLVRNLCLLSLLNFPVYFALQARKVVPDWDASHTAPVHGKSEDEESISPIPRPLPVYSAPRGRPRSDDDSTLVSTPHISHPIQRSIALESGWTICVDSWRKLWRNIVNAAFTIIMGYSMFLQMLGASGDHLTRFFAFLFLLRLVFALLSAGILLYYFSESHFSSGEFAMMWYQNVERHNNSYLYMPWTILALPAIALSWGAIFMLIAVLLSVWGDGLVHPSPSVEIVSPLTIICLRVIITAVSVVDVGWLSWLVVKLRALDEAGKARASAA